MHRISPLVLLCLCAAPSSIHAQDLSDRLFSDNANIRLAALKEAGELDAAARAALVPDLSKKIRDPRQTIRYFASEAMGRLGAPAVPALVTLLHDSGTDLRYRASEALGMIGAPALPAIMPVLQEQDDDVRCDAARALGRMGAVAQPAVQALSPLAASQNAKARYCVAEVFGRIGGPAALRALQSSLTDPVSDVKNATLNALNAFGGAAGELVPAVLALTKDENSLTRDIAARTLGEIGKGHPEVVPVLAAQVRQGLGYFAAGALGRLGPDAAGAVPDLLDALRRGRDSGVATAIIMSLGQIGPAAADAVPTLMQLWLQNDQSTRKAAVAAVGTIGPAGIPALVAGLRDARMEVQSGAAWQLGEFGGAAASAVPQLTALLQSKEATVRVSVVRALEKIGTLEAKAALPARPANRVARPANDARRLWTIAEIEAPIVPADGDRDAFTLGGKVEISAPGGVVLLATVHRADDLPDRLAIWRPVGSRYRRVALNGWDESRGGEGAILSAASFRIKEEHVIHLQLLIPGTASAHEDTFLWIAPDLTLHPIVFQSAPGGFTAQMKKEEGIWKGERNTFADDRMAFEFYIWNEGDTNCCPTAGRVTGQYKLVGKKRFDSVKKIWSQDFQIVPDAYSRTGIEDK